MNDALHISAEGLALVESFEGLQLTAYQDEGGVWTIGYGHTDDEGGIQITPGLTITEDQATQQLLADLASHEDRVKRFVTQPLNQGQFDALVSFDFNTGGLMLDEATVKARFKRMAKMDSILGSIPVGTPEASTLLAHLNANQPWEASAQFIEWNHVNGQVISGLTRRRNAERDLFCGFGWRRWQL